MLVKRFIGTQETDDLYLEYNFYTEEEIDEQMEKDAYPHWLETGERTYGNTPMPIDDAIRIIQELKDKGANYIEMDYHCDHVSYLFSGFEIRKATKEEIDGEQKRLDDMEKSKNLKRLNELKEEIKKLNNEV